jgi:hypothetical protein
LLERAVPFIAGKSCSVDRWKELFRLPLCCSLELCRALRRSIVTWIWLGAPGS